MCLALSHFDSRPSFLNLVHLRARHIGRVNPWRTRPTRIELTRPEPIVSARTWPSRACWPPSVVSNRASGHSGHRHRLRLLLVCAVATAPGVPSQPPLWPRLRSGFTFGLCGSATPQSLECRGSCLCIDRSYLRPSTRSIPPRTSSSLLFGRRPVRSVR